jgi:2-polyprenyl-3-methyl-5-hydroxy-6-metoxy-1,4-benzoquinol methylase
MSTNSLSASQNWKSIWSRKDMPDVSILQGEDLWASLIKVDGFDGGTGEIKIDDWKDYVRFLKKNLDVTPSDSIFEVGCGAGAFLYFFFLEGNKVGGIDYSSSLIENAKKIMNAGRFEVCEAANLQVDLKYDFVVANSIFFLFFRS